MQNTAHSTSVKLSFGGIEQKFNNIITGNNEKGPGRLLCMDDNTNKWQNPTSNVVLRWKNRTPEGTKAVGPKCPRAEVDPS